MSENTPFSAPQAGRTISGRQKQVDAAVAAAQAPAVAERDNSVTRHRPRAQASSFAPSGSTQRTFGAPINPPAVK